MTDSKFRVIKTYALRQEGRRGKGGGDCLSQLIHVYSEVSPLRSFFLPLLECAVKMVGVTQQQNIQKRQRAGPLNVS